MTNMNITFEFHTGFGLWIEANDENCYIIDVINDDDKDDVSTIVNFNGVIICLPFVKIHIGEFYEIVD